MVLDDQENTGMPEDDQERLKQSRVLISGLGGLGTTLAVYPAAAGAGSLVVDYAQVDECNLTRQFLYGPNDIFPPAHGG